MKRHISIFAFLLGAFVVQIAGAAVQTVEITGYLYESETTARTADLSAMVTPSECWANARNTAPVQLAEFTIHPPNGTTLSSWRYKYWRESDDQWKGITETTHPQQVEISGNHLAWSYESDTRVYLQFFLRYITYRIAYALDGGSWPAGAVHPTSAVYTNEVVVTNPERTGYDFTGWLPSNSKTPVPAGPSTTVLTKLATNENETVTVTAQWAARTYLLTLDPQEGTGGSASVTATYGADLPAITPPTRTGWTFTGYFSEVGGEGTKYYDAGGKGVRVWQETEPRTLYASYKPNTYTVVLHSNDGTDQTSEEPFTYGEQKELFTKPFNRTGYDFLGWSTDPASSTVEYKDGQKVSNLAPSGFFHLYAVWSPIGYSVTFNANGGEGMMEPVSLTYGETFTVPPCEFTREACTFRFWSAVINNVATNFEVGAVVSNLTSTADGEVEFTANWIGSYTLAYDANGGAGTMTNETVALDAAHQLASNRFTKTGYHFLGWVTNAESSVVLWTDGAVVTNLAGVAETRTLYAVWGANAYRVTFNPNATDVTGEMAPQAFVYDQAETPLRANAFDRGEFWEFACWTNAETGATYADEAPVRNLTAVPGGEVRLDAVWKTTLSDLSLAMGCGNLKWEPDVFEKWTVCATDGLGGVPPCVEGVPGGQTGSGVMNAAIATNGTLKFSYRFVNAGDDPMKSWLTVQLVYGPAEIPIKLFETPDLPSDWTSSGEIDVKLPENYSKATLRFQYYDYGLGTGAVHIDGMTWTPEGGEPKYADEDAKVTEFSMADGKLNFSFDSDGGSTYHILGTSDVTAPWPWPFVREIEADEMQPVQIDIKADEPKMFYRIRALIP